MGLKWVFLKEEDTSTDLTQIAYGRLKPGEICPKHKHLTMEEYFYFVKGTGKYMIDGKVSEISPGLFLRIPAEMEHQLEAIGDSHLEFVYFGIATE